MIARVVTLLRSNEESCEIADNDIRAINCWAHPRKDTYSDTHKEQIRYMKMGRCIPDQYALVTVGEEKILFKHTRILHLKKDGKFVYVSHWAWIWKNDKYDVFGDQYDTGSCLECEPRDYNMPKIVCLATSALGIVVNCSRWHINGHGSENGRPDDCEYCVHKLDEMALDEHEKTCVNVEHIWYKNVCGGE